MINITGGLLVAPWLRAQMLNLSLNLSDIVQESSAVKQQTVNPI
jgi:hypothetical protein